MAYEHKDGSGALFKNTKKEKDTHPDYRGELMLNGVLLEVAAWIKDGAKGKYMSISAKPKTEKLPSMAPAKVEPRGSVADMADDIPF
jgi:hypothetical protein